MEGPPDNLRECHLETLHYTCKDPSPNKVIVTVLGRWVFWGHCLTHYSRPYWVQQVSPSSWTTFGHPTFAGKETETQRREGSPDSAPPPGVRALRCQPAFSLGPAGQKPGLRAQQTRTRGSAFRADQPTVFGLTSGQQTPTHTQTRHFSKSGVQTRGGEWPSVLLRDKERGPSGTDTGSARPPGLELHFAVFLTDGAPSLAQQRPSRSLWLAGDTILLRDHPAGTVPLWILSVTEGLP